MKCVDLSYKTFKRLFGTKRVDNPKVIKFEAQIRMRRDRVGEASHICTTMDFANRPPDTYTREFLAVVLAGFGNEYISFFHDAKVLIRL